MLLQDGSMLRQCARCFLAPLADPARNGRYN